MRVGVLTSSRSDYSICFPLLKELSKDDFFDLNIICFGTHLSKKHGHTIDFILRDGFEVPFRIETLSDNESDSPLDIGLSIGQTILKFSAFWNKEKFDWVICLGDRYEMFAACAASIPFNIRLAHIHGGEQTLGAIDEVFRHSITHMAALHFASTEKYAERVAELKHNKQNVYNTGALSIDNLKDLELLTTDAFSDRYGIDLTKPTILITLHPETVSFEKNEEYTNTLIEALKEIKGYHFVITMPNADTMGNMIREKLMDFIDTHNEATGVESFGTIGYLSCMKHCSFLLGNTSSGFIEASFFPKYVINMGERQKGRILTANIRNVEINKNAILEAVSAFNEFNPSENISIYGDGNAAKKITTILKKY